MRNVRKCPEFSVLLLITFYLKIDNLGLAMLIYNHFHNILRLFDVLINFPFTTSETMRDYYL